MKTKELTENSTDISTSTLAMHCYEQIQEEIISGTLAPGQKLKVEHLKEQLKVGQSPVREALARLVSSGLVELIGNRGFRVAEVSERDVRDLYEVYFNIEMLALTQALERGDDAWEATVVVALHRLAQAENSTEPVPYSVWGERNYNFHVALISGCYSPLLLHIRADVYKRFDRYCRIAFDLPNSDLVLNHEEHAELAAAVLKRDLKKATELMRHHIFGALEDVIMRLKVKKLI